MGSRSRSFKCPAIQGLFQVDTCEPRVKSSMGVWVCKIRPGPMGAYLGRRRATPLGPQGAPGTYFLGRSVDRSVVVAAAAAAAAAAVVVVVVVVVARAGKFRT